MPRVKIELIEGRSIDQKRLVAEAVTDVIVRHFGVIADTVTVRFEEVPAHNVARGGVLRSEV